MSTSTLAASCLPFLLSGALSISLGVSAHAADDCPEESLQHWTPGSVAYCPCFVAGEQAGVVFEAPAEHYPLEILRFQIYWTSQSGTEPPSLQRAIHLYSGGFPDPGTPQYTYPSPLLIDGFLNEFDLTQVPGDRVIDSGPFSLTLEFETDTTPDDSFIASDGTGCQPGKNLVYAIPGGWEDACALGVSGDWIMTVIYRPLCCDDEAAWQNYGLGFPGSNGVPTLIASDDPVLGSSISIDLGNSQGTDSSGVLFVGFQQVSIPGSWGGDLLVLPVLTVPVALQPDGLSFPFVVPNDNALCGLGLSYQFLQLDTGAADGIASSQGLELLFGR